MKYRAVVHRRFADDAGAEYVYVAPSASILRLDDTSRDVLDAFADAAEPDALLTRPDAAELRETFADMVAIGLLRPDGEVAPPAADMPPMPYPLATLVLNVTNKCNLSCTYCYEYGEDRIADGPATGSARRAMMTPEVAAQSVDFLFASSKSRPKLQLTFFGGETLLNFATIRAATEHAEARARESGKLVSFALTTNATLLDDAVIDFLIAHRFGVNVSIDGDAGDHDRHRRFRSGRGSFDVVRPRIERLLEQNRAVRGRPIGARVTLTKGAGPLRDTYRFLVGELGFDEVGFAPVTSAPGRGYALDGEDYGHLLREFGELADDFVGCALRGEPHGFANLHDLLRELHQGVNKAHPCGAGLGLLGVSTEGRLGLCHRFVESGTHEIGDVAAGIDERKRTSFLHAGHVSTKPPCQTCFARPVCAGGCYHEAFVRYGDAALPNVHHCDWIRSFTDIGLRAYARIAAGNPGWLARFDS
jgi:uncharacterized protein